MQVTNRMNGEKHILYSRSYYFNTDYTVERDCCKCDKCDKCIYSTINYLHTFSNKYKYIDTTNFQCPCPSVLLKYIIKDLCHIVLNYLL